MAFGPPVVGFTVALLALGSGASAREPAPVVFAGGAPGAAETLYGYGGGKHDTPVIDLRGTLPVSNSVEEARPAWLETERAGAPYTAQGTWYAPTPEPGYEQTGVAATYRAEFRGKATAAGEAFKPEAFTAAHPTLPIPSLVQVTNAATGAEVILRVNDRGPFDGESVINVSPAAAQALSLAPKGSRVHVRYLGPAPKRMAPVAMQKASVGAAPSLSPTAPIPTTQGGYVIQAAAFSNEANARKASARLEQAGSTRVAAPTAPAGFFKVQVGPWQTRAQADVALQTVRKLGFSGAQISQAR